MKRQKDTLEFPLTASNCVSSGKSFHLSEPQFFSPIRLKQAKKLGIKWVHIFQLYVCIRISLVAQMVKRLPTIFLNS